MHSGSAWHCASVIAGLFFLVAVAVDFVGRAWAGEWTDGATMNSARAFAAGAQLNEDIYVVGGTGITGPQSSMEIYDSVGDIWRGGAALTEGVQQSAASFLSGHLYLTGGYKKESRGADNKAFYMLDPAFGVWVKLADMPGPRAWHGSAAFNGKLYVIGGVGAGSERVFIYDPLAENWSVAKERMPAPRFALAVVVLEGKIWAIGGRLRNGQVSARVDVFDPVSETWSRGIDLTVPRAGHAAAVEGGRIHVIGGEQLSPAQTFTDHFVLESGASEWAVAQELRIPRHGLVVTAADDQVTAIGGASGPGFYSVFTQSDTVNRYR